VNVVVIGAGPAGLLAAGQAAAAGARVLLLEKMEQPARKLRITGKGRCNITNTKPWAEFERHVFPLARMFRPAFMNFSNTAVIHFLESIGLPTVVERGDRVFPASQRAQDVADVLVRWVQRQGVTIRCNTEVVRLLEDNGRITAVEIRRNGMSQILPCKSLVVATGGLSYPLTGSTGDGFRFAEATGHAVTPLRPSLVALTVENFPAALTDLTLRNVSLALWIDGNKVDEEFGELCYTDSGMEGPVILRLSRAAVDALLQHKKVALELNCKPALSQEQIITRLQRETTEMGNQSVQALLRKWLSAQLIAEFIQKANILPKKTAKLTVQELSQIATTLQSWRMNVTGYGGYERAVVTAGGVSMKDIDFKTMRSRKIENLFFAGEVLDLDADTGGYNLQIAFSTGYLAGVEAAKQAIKN